MSMSKTRPAISVIIPMYNVENYIGFCMDSLFDQTFQDFEILLIDDASKDRTYELCRKKYAEDKRVKLMRNNANKGQCFSRNTGMKFARGKYIYFMDSDDELLPMALEIMYGHAEKEKADVVHCNFYFQVYTKDRMLMRKTLWEMSAQKNQSYGVMDWPLKERLHYQAWESLPMPWLNLYRRGFLFEEKMSFVDLPISEDDVFSIEAVLKAKRYVMVNECYYLYRRFWNEKERVMARLPGAFNLMLRVLRELEKVFGQYTAEEIPLTMRLSIKTGWINAHLRFWIMEILDSGNVDDLKLIERILKPLVGEASFLVSQFVHMIDYNSGMRDFLIKSREEERNRYLELWSAADRGDTEHKGDYVYLYSAASRALQVEEGDELYYRAGFLQLAKAALMRGKHQEAVSAYRKALNCLEKDRQEWLKVYWDYLYAMHFTDCTEQELFEAYLLYEKKLALDEDISVLEERAQAHMRMPCSCVFVPDDDTTYQGVPAADGFINFGMLGDYHQLSDEVLKLWQELLVKLPQVRLRVRSEEFNVQAMMFEAVDRFSHAGFDMSRVFFETEDGAYREWLLSVDVMLAVYPCIDVTRILESLFMGVPIIALSGERMDTRLPLSVLSMVGLQDLSASNGRDYIDKATSLAGDTDFLDLLHQKLRGMMLSSTTLQEAISMGKF